MLINQRTFTVKRGHREEAVAHLVATFAKLNPPIRTRILMPNVAPLDQLIFETEHEDMASYQQDWDRITNEPWFADAINKWNTLTEAGGTNYIWSVAGD